MPTTTHRPSRATTPTDRPPPDPRRRRLLVGAGLLTAVAAVIVAAFLSVRPNAAPEIDCRARTVLVDPSSSMDTATWRRAQDVVRQAAQSAAVCDETFLAASAVPGSTVTIIDSDALGFFDPHNDDDDRRRARFSEKDAATVDQLVDDGMARVTSELPADRSDLATLLNVAARHTGEGTDVIIVTDGVHRDDTIDLNRPLATGDGARLAAELTFDAFTARTVRFVGVAQVDADAAAPSERWAREVFAFVDGLCDRLTVQLCTALEVAAMDEVFG